MRNKPIEDFLRRNIHEETVDSILLISAPVNDSADYDEITMAGVHNAIRPFTKWLDESDVEYEVQVTWGDSWLDDSISSEWSLYINVSAKATLKNKAWTKEDMMLFKLKFNDILPITDLGPYITGALT